MWEPLNDGVDHINVYSKGRTELGKFLSNFTYAELETEDGPFKSVEGYWYWLGTTHENRDMLREASGFQAKDWGRQLKALDWQDTPDFQRKICAAIELKVRNRPKMAKLLVESRLPLVHYYSYGGKIIEPERGVWVIDFIDELRTRLREEK